MGPTRISLFVGGLTGVAAAPVLAHSVDGLPGNATGLPWSFEPWVMFCLGVSATFYAVGLVRLWRHAGQGHGVSVRQASAFATGWLTLVLALVTPLDPLGSVLFSAHMVQHELLMLVAAPLLVVGRPLALWVWALPQPWRRMIGSFFHHPAWRLPWLIVTGPLAAWLLHALALWLWHIPALFDAALNDPTVHAWQHATFLLTALLFWWSVLGAVTRKEQGLALISLFTTMVHTGALGALLTLARTPWYAHYFGTASTFHIDALEDQQLGGLIMWVPAGAIYILCGLVIASKWVKPRVQRAPRLSTR
jgi:putative membrane protein